MRFTKLTFFLIASMLPVMKISAQCKVKATAKADYAYITNSYSLAIEQYSKAKSKVKKDKAAKSCIDYHLAKCYLKLRDFKKAESKFKAITKTEGVEPVVYLEYANLLKSQGRYEEAKPLYEKYAKMKPSDPTGEIGAKSCEMAVQWINNPSCYQVENRKEWNTKEMDFSPMIASKKGNEVIFSTNRAKSYGRNNPIANELYEDLWKSTKGKDGKWSTPVSLEDPINSEKSEGASTMDSKYRVLYFTRCVSNKKDGSYCAIYKTQRTGNKWNEPEKLELGGDSGTVTGHPTLTDNGQVLIFASNMAGGEGGMDLWYATYDRKKKTFVNPVNLGKEINTRDNEMYPHLRLDGNLYFSSDKPEGMGGLDIYKSVSVGDNKWGKPENMKYPLNSAGDDFGIIFESGKEQGYLSSNRQGGKGSDDIYSFSIPQATITLSGTVRDKETNQPLQNAKVELKDPEGKLVEIKTDATGFYKKDIPFGVTYDMTASKEKYFNDVNRASSFGLDPLINCKDTTIIADFYLKPIKEVTFEIQFVFTKAQIFPEHIQDIKNLYTILIDNPTLVVEIGGFTDSRGDNKSNQALSERRSQAIIDSLIEMGIEKERLTKKGYGEEVPRTLKEDMKGFETGYIFPKGTVLTDEYLNKLKTEQGDKVFEDGHRLNRRIEMKVLRDDHKPKNPPKDDDDAGTQGGGSGGGSGSSTSTDGDDE